MTAADLINSKIDDLVTLRDMAAKELVKSSVFPSGWKFLLDNSSLPVHAITLDMADRFSKRDRENILWLIASKYRIERLVDLRYQKCSPSFLTMKAEEEFNLAMRLLNF